MRIDRPTVAIVLAVLAASGPSALADGRPADPLLRLAPPEAAVTLAVEDLREHARQFAGSPLAEGLAELPAVRAWRDSEEYRTFQTARKALEATFGITLEQVRDDLLGDAAVLVLVPEPGDDPEAARGLLLCRVREPALLERLVRTINAVERNEGSLARVEDRSHGSVAYHVRRFAPESGKQDEAYAVVEGNVFAWSNSPTLVLEVIDRSRGGHGGGLADEPRFRRVREALPAGALASLYVDPAFLRRLDGGIPISEGEDRSVAEPLAVLGRRYVDALEYLGIALDLRDGLVLHEHETFDPSKIDEPLRRWASRPGDSGALLHRAPADPLALVAGRVDLGAVWDEAISVLGEPGRAKADNILVVLSGLLLGKDPRSEVFPRVGPGVVAYLVREDDPEAPGEAAKARLAVVLGVELADEPGVSEALGNALRTVLALAALDPKRAGAELRVESQERDGVRLTALVSKGKVLLAYRVEPGLLALGNSSEAVRSFVRGPSADRKDSAFEAVRDRYFPRARTFLYADLEAIGRLAAAQRDTLAGRLAAERKVSEDSARRDLDQVLALVRLFRAGYLTRTVDEGFRSVHHTLGLISRERAAP
jgi:hypothetical protein